MSGGALSDPRQVYPTELRPNGISNIQCAEYIHYDLAINIPKKRVISP